MIRSFLSLSQTGDSFLIRWLLLLFVLLLVFSLLSAYFFYKGKAKWYQLYFPVILCLGMFYGFVLSPLSAPDEVAHYITSYELSSQILRSPTPLYDEEGRLMIRSEDVFIDDWQGDMDPDNATVVGRNLTRELYRELHERGLKSSGETGFHYTLQDPLKTTKLAYLFPALGFCLARILGLGGFSLLFMGRFMNLLLFTILGTMAVRRTPVGQELFFGISLCPMLLELVSSLSYDCFILALSFYLLAVILDLALSKERVTKGDIITLSVLAVGLSPCKMVYSLLFLGCFMIPKRKFGSNTRYFSCIILIGVLMVLSIAAVNFSNIMRYVFPSNDVVNSVDWVEGAEALETYNLQELLKTPIILLKILRNTLQIQGAYYLYTMAGGALGHLEEGLGLNVPFLYLFYIALFLLNFSGDQKEPKMKLWQRVISLMAALSVFILLLVTMLTAYTPLRTDYVLGVQGRYFLPILPAFFMSFHGKVLQEIGGKSGKFLKRVLQELPAIIIYIEILMNAGLLLYLFMSVSLRTI